MENRLQVTIVGRPNVGKSTLFNALTRSNRAIIDDRPGITRDRIYGVIQSAEHGSCTVIDTGGFESDSIKFQPFVGNPVWEQTKMALDMSDLVLLVLDGKAGLTEHDHVILREIKQRKKPYLILVNKLDGKEKEQELLWDFLAFDENLIPLSATHKRNFDKLIYKIFSTLKKLTNEKQILAQEAQEKIFCNIAIVGRPNVGKSSLLNRLCGEQRSLVSEISGTTRDTVDTLITYNQNKYRIIDTAGIRKKSRVHDRIDSVSMIRAFKAIEECDVVLIVADSLEGFGDQDSRLADFASTHLKPIIVVMNKWDLVENKNTMLAKKYEESIREKLKSIQIQAIKFISCQENVRVHSLLKIVEHTMALKTMRIGTHKVNEALQEMIQENTPHLNRKHSKRIKFYFATQVDVAPPSLVIFSNVPKELSDAYIRYMHHSFRKKLGFENIPMRLTFRGKNEKKENKEALS